MSNIFTYGWKVKVDPASMQAALRGMSSPDDAVTWAAVLGCMAFYMAALAIERLGWALLRRETKVRGVVLLQLFCVLLSALLGLLC
jgi:cytochrome b561